MNKRGQELSTSTIILIILGVIVLVVLVLGFTIGWNKVLPFTSQNNVNIIQTQCTAACSTNSIYDFCSRTFDLNSGATTIKNATCNFLTQPQNSQYGISSCSSVTCSNIVFLDNTNSQFKKADDLQAQCGANTGKTVATLIGNTLVSVNCS